MNVRRHSGARRVRVTLGVEGGEVVGEVSDDGRGFEPDVSAGIGLTGMRERAAALGARLEIRSEAGEGTSVRFSVPLARFSLEVARRGGAG